MNFNVITPLARYQNINNLIDNLKPNNVIWHVITDNDSHTNLQFSEPWINHYVCPNTEIEFWARCNFSINWFIDNYEINDDDYYCILNDDDAYEDDFFNKLKSFMDESKENKDLYICSMLRGHNIPTDVVPIRRHPNTTLHAHPSHMKVGEVGVEQFFVKGHILKNHRLPLTTCGDGELITELVKTYDATYLPNFYVWFNYFEPGRWNK
jgi:hypothetical protein